MFKRPRFVIALLALSFSGVAAAQEVYRDAPTPQNASIPGATPLPQWSLSPSTGVKASLDVSEREVPGGRSTRVVKVDYDFQKNAGYVIARLPLNIDLPPYYRVAFTASASGATNTLECKLVDGSVRGIAADPVGDNVWWYVERPLVTGEAHRFSLPRRKFSFAWGPGGDRAELKRLGALEFAITASEGGQGTVELSDITIEQQPAPLPYTATPTITASSRMCVLHDPSNLADADPSTAWQSDIDDYEDNKSVWLQYDFGASSPPRGFGGITIDWEAGFAPASFQVTSSLDGQQWSTIASAPSPVSSSRTILPLNDTYARFVKFTFSPTAKPGAAGVQNLRFEEIGFADSANTLVASVGSHLPRGSLPRSLTGEQTYWTVVGAPGDRLEALVSEDGTLEPFKGEFSVEPFIIETPPGQQAGNAGSIPLVRSWADGTHTQSLADKMLPLPVVQRSYDGLDLTMTFIGEGRINDSSVLACYEVTNTSQAPKAGRLLLALRPFQVLPPWQRLNIEGGAGKLTSVTVQPPQAGQPTTLIMNGERAVVFYTKPDAQTFSTFDAGFSPSDILAGTPLATSPPTATENSTTTAPAFTRNLCSAGIVYDYDLPPDTSKRWWIVIPLHATTPPPRLDAAAANPDPFFQRATSLIADSWMKTLVRTRLQLPPEAQPMLESWYVAAAHILINMDGQAFQPGSRTYERSWMRDGALTSAAMLDAGFPELAKPFLSWYGGFQYDFGKIPCVVDSRGADPVDENDSTGQYLFALWNYFQFTKDIEFLKSQLPRVVKAVSYLQYMTAMRSTAEFQRENATRQEPGKPPVPISAFFGMVPESISHEGYSAKPMHSYWDNYFTLSGFDSAIAIAGVLGEPTQATLWKRARDTFAKDLTASIAATQAAHNITYLPGCVELGDFDSTSTTIALFPTNAAAVLPAKSLAATFDRYWSEFTSRRDVTPATWEAFTPYELRHVGAFVRVGDRGRALDSMNWFISQQRPSAWRQWQEVVWREPRATKFIGDSPHTWCASDFMNSFRSLFLFERAEDSSLVILAGVPESWVRAEGVAFQDMPSHYGKLSCRVVRSKNQFTITLTGDVTPPPGGIVVTSPSLNAIQRATVNDKPALTTPRGEVIVNEMPAKVIIQTF